MTREDIIRMAREAGLSNDFGHFGYPYLPELERLVAIVEDAQAKRMHAEGMVTVGHMRQQIAAEREACAKVADLVAREMDDTNGIATYIAAALRARGQA